MNQPQVTVRHRFQLHGGPTETQEIAAILPPPPAPLCTPDELAIAHRLVVRRDAGLGDCLMIMPALAAIRECFGHLKITFQAPAPYTELLAGFGEVDEAVALDEPIEFLPGPDVVRVDLSNYVERHAQAWTMPRIDLVGTAFGISPLPHAACYQPPAEVQREAKAWLGSRQEPPSLQLRRTRCRSYRKEVEGNRRLGIALRGIYGHRSWLVPHVFELARRLAAQSWDVLIFDADPFAPEYPWANDPAIGGTVACTYGVALPMVAALLSQCDAAVVPDTGLLHLAACVGTPFVAIFGAVPPELRLYYYENYRCLTAQGRVPCVPCCEGPQHNQCEYECLWAITPGEVARALHGLLADVSQP